MLADILYGSMDKLITENLCLICSYIISLSGILINTLQSDMQALLYENSFIYMDGRRSMVGWMDCRMEHGLRDMVRIVQIDK